MAAAMDLKFIGRNLVRVRLPPPAPFSLKLIQEKQLSRKDSFIVGSNPIKEKDRVKSIKTEVSNFVLDLFLGSQRSRQTVVLLRNRRGAKLLQHLRKQMTFLIFQDGKIDVRFDV